VKKSDIIASASKDLCRREGRVAAKSDDVRAYERHVAAEIEKRLDSIAADLDVPTCADFAHLGVGCCSICHIDYPDYELALVEIELGGRAWLCCSLDHALSPVKHVAMEQSPEWQELVRIFDNDPAKWVL
jgi:hypothetical protein